MTDEQKAAYVNAQAALLNAEVAMYQAENMMREHHGHTIAYGEEAFHELFEKYDSVLGHNAVMGLFHG